MLHVSFYLQRFTWLEWLRAQIALEILCGMNTSHVANLNHTKNNNKCLELIWLSIWKCNWSIYKCTFIGWDFIAQWTLHRLCMVNVINMAFESIFIYKRCITNGTLHHFWRVLEKKRIKFEWKCFKCIEWMSKQPWDYVIVLCALIVISTRQMFFHMLSKWIWFCLCHCHAFLLYEFEDNLRS